MLFITVYTLIDIIDIAAQGLLVFTLITPQHLQTRTIDILQTQYECLSFVLSQALSNYIHFSSVI